MDGSANTAKSSIMRSQDSYLQYCSTTHTAHTAQMDWIIHSKIIPGHILGTITTRSTNIRFLAEHTGAKLPHASLGVFFLPTYIAFLMKSKYRAPLQP